MVALQQVANGFPVKLSGAIRVEHECHLVAERVVLPNAWYVGFILSIGIREAAQYQECGGEA